jgi:zinc/manganese transport system ATP-binding protein
MDLRHLGGGDPMSRGTISISGLSVAYDRRAAVRDVSGSFPAGSLTAIVGPNGAGKSTLVKAIVGILRPASGKIARQGITTDDLAYLPQAAEIDRTFPISVVDTVMLGAWRRTGAFRRVDRALQMAARDALNAVGLDGFAQRPIGALSAGQFQRVLFARLLLQDATVIVLDEPFSAIDTRTTRDLLDIVRRWHGEKRTIIAVLHDFEQVRANFPHTLLLAREQVAWGATESVLSPANLLQARAMAERWEDDAPAASRAGIAA